MHKKRAPPPARSDGHPGPLQGRLDTSALGWRSALLGPSNLETKDPTQKFCESGPSPEDRAPGLPLAQFATFHKNATKREKMNFRHLSEKEPYLTAKVAIITKTQLHFLMRPYFTPNREKHRNFDHPVSTLWKWISFFPFCEIFISFSILTDLAPMWFPCHFCVPVQYFFAGNPCECRRTNFTIARK